MLQRNNNKDLGIKSIKIPRRSENFCRAEFSSERREWCYLLISDLIGGRTRHGRQFSKLGFTVQLVPRYALLVRDQGRAREKGRSNCMILTQSRGCKRHAAPLHSTPLRVATAPHRHIMPACARRWCERPRLDSRAYIG